MRSPDKRAAGYAFPRWLTAGLALALSTMVIGGAAFYRVHERRLQREIEENLLAIAHLKAAQLIQWRAERLQDAAERMASPFTSEAMARWLKNSQGAAAEAGLKELVLTRFRLLQQYRHYRDVMLVDPGGSVLLSLTGRRGQMHDDAGEALRTALRERRPVLTDLGIGPDDLPPHTDTIAPLFAGGEDPPRALGALVLQSDAREFLYPMIQSWPTSSRSAESLLVRRDGDAVLFLNELRHRADTALRLRIPLSRTDVPAVGAVLGKEGVFQGRDYRGVAVLAVLKAIPDSPWFLVTKVDVAEAFATWRFESALILGLFLGITSAAAATVAVVWQRNAKTHLSALLQAEEARRESEKKYRTLIETMDEGLGIQDKDGLITYMNPRGCAMFGYACEEVLGKPLTTLLDEDNRKIFLQHLTERRQGEQTGYEITVTRKDGGKVHTLVSPRPLLDEKGAFAGSFGVFTDITARRDAEIAAREAEERYRMLFDSTVDGIFIVDGRGRIIDVNRTAHERLGYTKEELLSLTIQELDSPEFAPVVPQRMAEIHERGRAVFESAHRRKDGSVMPVEVNARILDDQGEKVFFSAIRDISERKQAETRLRESERLLAESQRIAHLGTWEVDVATNRILWSAEMYRIFGVAPASFGHTTEDFLALIYPDDRAAMQEWIGSSLAGANPMGLEFRRVHPDDGLRYIHGRGELQADAAGRPLRMVGTAQDVTEGRRAREEKEKLQTQLLQAQKMEFVGRLAGGVAHDFNNMLAVILSHAELAMLKGGPADPRHAALRKIHEAAQRSADLTRQLLAFARKQTVMPKLLDLNVTTAGMLAMLQRLIGEEVHLVWVPGRSLGKVRIDPVQVDQILANLVVNARDAVQGVGTITIETSNVVLDDAYCADHAECAPGEYVQLAVSDTGAGMSKEVLDHVFEPFFTTKEVGKGTGMGLATVYGIVMQNRGIVNAYSEPGLGTTFRVYLPRDLSTETESAKENAAAAPPAGGTETVLLVEDEPALLHSAKEILSSLGYAVLAAGSPREALRGAGEHAGAIHLLITDVVMPEMNGRDLARQLTAARPQMRTLFMSGYTADVITHRGVLEGERHFIQKPFSIHDLARKVREALQGEA